MTDWQIHAAVAIWWSVAVFIIFVSRDPYEHTKLTLAEVISVAACWPLFVVPGAVVILWRNVFFKSPKVIRSDLRNRKLLRDFEKFIAARKGGDDA